MSLSTCVKSTIALVPKPYVLCPVAYYGVNTDNLRVIQKPNLASTQRGTGFRSSFNGIVCTIFGGYGCIGRCILNILGNRGTQCIIPYRCVAESITDLKIAGDLGQVLFTPFNLRDEDSIRRAVKYSDVVINCIGTDYETSKFKYRDVHVDGARLIAKISREMGVKKLIHFSAMGVSPNPPVMLVPGGSRFLKTKWEGEQRVREEFPNAIIVRPSETYGEHDRYFLYYAAHRTTWMRRLYLYKKGLETIKMPIFNVDVADGIYQLVIRHNKDVEGKTYQFVGPRSYLLYDLARYLYKLKFADESYGFSIEDSRHFILFPLIKFYFSKEPIKTKTSYFTDERWERENTTDKLDPNLPLIQDLGIQPRDIEIVAPHFMNTYYVGWFQRYKEVYEYPRPELRVINEIKPSSVK